MDNKEEDKKEIRLNEATQQMIVDNISHMVALKLLAKNMFSYYESLTEEGFTDQQAFQIILTRGLQP